MSALRQATENKWSDSAIIAEETHRREQLRQASAAHLADLRRHQVPLRSFILKDERDELTAKAATAD
jgi:hypothetical protein